MSFELRMWLTISLRSMIAREIRRGRKAIPWAAADFFDSGFLERAYGGVARGPWHPR